MLGAPRDLRHVIPTAAGDSIKSSIAGAAAGAIEISITYPTEYIKTQLQLDSKGADKKYTGSFDCMRKTIKERGIFGLYRGLGILLLGTIPKTACRFGTFEILSNLLRKSDGTTNTTRSFFAGLGTGVIEAIMVVTPMETIKVQLINDMRSPKPMFKGMFHGISQIVAKGGIGGLYMGLGSTAIKHGTNQAIGFSIVHGLKNWYTGGDPNVKVPKIAVGSFGSLAGVVSVLFNNPVDVVKTRMQGIDAHRYKNEVDCIRRIVVDEGFGALYKGLQPRVLRMCFNVGITFMMYETIMDLMNSIWK